MLHNRYLRLCLQSEASSFLLFKVAMCGLHMIQYFSFVQRLHDLAAGEYGEPFATIFHCNVNAIFLSLRVQIQLLSVVEFRLLSFLKELVCPLYLILKVFSVRPMQVSSLLLSSLFTEAWYMTPSVRHFPFNGHSFFLLQLQFRSLASFWVDFFRMDLLWFVMTFFTFGMQLQLTFIVFLFKFVNDEPCNVT